MGNEHIREQLQRTGSIIRGRRKGGIYAPGEVARVSEARFVWPSMYHSLARAGVLEDRSDPLTNLMFILKFFFNTKYEI